MEDKEYKRNGRIIKKDSTLFDKVRVKKFNLSEIREVDVLYSDNAGRNIIQKKLHEEEELDKGVRPYKDFDKELLSPDLSSPVIFPRNFTKDWLRDKNRAKRKNSSLFEYEDDDFFEQMASQEQLDLPNDSNEDQENLQESVHLENSSQENKNNPKDHKLQNKSNNSADTSEILGEMQKSSIDDSFRIVGNAIKEMEAAALSHSDDQATRDEHAETNNDAIESQMIDTIENQLKQSEDNGFVETEVHGVKEGTPIEDAAIAEYHKQKDIKDVDVEGIKEEAKARGFEEGFRSGEERAALNYKQKAEELFLKVQEILHELTALKKDILENIEDNFFEISQAMCESLIGKAVDIQPELFANIIKKAISEAVESDDFKIVVSPTMEKILNELDIPDIKNKVKSDSAIGEGNFKIESKLGTVDSGIKKIVSDLLESANIQLFSDKDSDPKAS